MMDNYIYPPAIYGTNFLVVIFYCLFRAKTPIKYDYWFRLPYLLIHIALAA